MSREIQNVQLKFSCHEQWDNMSETAGGRHCDKCQKKVYDFTGSKADEFIRIMAENDNNVCGRFKLEQMSAILIVLPFWQRWIAAAMLLVGIQLFSACKNDNHTLGEPKAGKRKAVANSDLAIDKNTCIDKSSVPIMGMVGGSYKELPSFIGGKKAWEEFLYKNISYPKKTPNGKVIAGFVVNTDGRLSNYTIIKSLSFAADQEVIRVLKLSPKWIPGKANGKIVPIQFAIPVTFADK